MALGIIRGGLVAASALLAFSAPGLAQPVLQSPHAGAAHNAARPAGDRALTVLYDQTGDASGFGTVSQDFGDVFTSEAADDFTVPSGAHWTIKEVDVPGAYFNGQGPAPSVDVVIHRDRHGPDRIIRHVNTVPASDEAGSFVLKIPRGFKLQPGHYWLSIIPIMDFDTGGQWFWENQNRGTKEGKTAMWRNPGDGYGSGCTVWTPETKCVPNKFGDQMFTLKGVEK